MNILITLPKNLLEKIISGEKKFEMRKCLPKNMEVGVDGFFVVEKGTNKVKCWCRVAAVIEMEMTKPLAEHYAADLCVTPQYVLDYAPVGTKVYLWQIGKVTKILTLRREDLHVWKNPQEFAYCPLSSGKLL